jgi:RNA polymerase sigma-70 factor (ECF subfamily)
LGKLADSDRCPNDGPIIVMSNTARWDSLFLEIEEKDRNIVPPAAVGITEAAMQPESSEMAQHLRLNDVDAPRFDVGAEPERLFGLCVGGRRDRTDGVPSSQEDVTLVKDNPLLSAAQLAQFEQVVLPHLDSAYNLARWLMCNDADAEDVVQEAYLRAAKFFASFRGADGRPWLLAIVRRAGYDWLDRNRSHQGTARFDEQLHSQQRESSDPPALLLREEDREILRQALADLPFEYREVLVLRELEGLSYKEIGAITGIPPGTVMSRLARGRERLRDRLARYLREGA